jgi:hypothetical protein
MREFTSHWVDPTTGAIYQQGDRIDIRYTDHGAYYNEEVVRVECDGFPGGAMQDEHGNLIMSIPELEPTGAVFVGPASEAWSWQYRQSQWCKHLAMMAANAKHFLDD